MKTKIFIFGLILLCFFAYSQDVKYTYYIEFTNSSSKPTVVRQSKNAKTIALNNSQIEVIQYNEVFSNYTKKSLRNTSLIEFKTLNDFNNFIFNNKNYIVKYEKIDTVEDPILEGKKYDKSKVNKEKKLITKNLLYTPNDYYLTSVNIGHTYLDLINAQEAWDYSKGDGIIVGISDDGFRLSHQEFTGKISTIPGQTLTQNDDHGNLVAGLAAANTDNNFGNSSIGFNAQLMVTDHYTSGSWGYLKQLSDNGAKVINMSWLSSPTFIQSEQDAVNELYSNGTVLVAASGNASYGSSYAKVYPASYDNVISVSGVGHLNEIGGPITTNVKDVHYFNYGTLENKFQNNEDVDIVAPAIDMTGLPSSGCDTCLGQAFNGTSFAAPLVSGTVALLFSSNSCLSPLEVETILKLTSANIDQLAPNEIFAGLLGAGRLDAGKANKMAWQMNPDNGGEVLIENKNFNRWNFELINSPENIKIQNESFTGSSNVNFKAKQGITLDVNTLLMPNAGKSHYFYIDDTDTCSSTITSPTTRITKEISESLEYIKLYPNPFTDIIKISDIKGIEYISINDMSGRQIKRLVPSLELNLSSLKVGLYLINLHMEDGSIKTVKAVKK